jgi:type I restriction enzyme S subunit
LNAEGIEKRPLIAETEGATRYFQRKSGQFIYGKQNLHKGAFGVVPPELNGFESSSDLPAFDVADGLRPEWLVYFLKQGNFYKSLVAIAKGAATKRIQPEALFAVELPVPGMDVQDEIINRMNHCGLEHSRLEHEITHQQSLLAKLKHAILQEAIEGKLTSDWRASHPEVEPARELLERIQAEKASMIAAKKLRPEKPLPKITPAEIPFGIPKGWEWCRLGSIAMHSLGKMLDKGKNRGESKPYLRNLNVRWYGVELSNLKMMPFEHQELEKYSVRRGDVLICEGGHGIGRAAVWNSDNLVMFQKALHRVRFIGGFYEPTLLVHFLRLSEMSGHITNYFTGAGIPHFTGEKLHEMAIPLPPLEEQAAIVKRVESLMATCRALETEIEQTRTHAAHLLQAVLKEAFAPAST